MAPRSGESGITCVSPRNVGRNSCQHCYLLVLINIYDVFGWSLYGAVIPSTAERRMATRVYSATGFII